MQFNLVGHNYIAVLENLPSHVDIYTLKYGGVYAGSFVLSVLHPGMVVPVDIVDVDIFFDDTHSGVGREVNHPLYSRMPSVKKVNNFNLRNFRFMYIETDLDWIDLVLNLQDHFDLDKCASRIYYNRDADRVELAVPANKDMDPLSINMYWNYDGIYDEELSHARGLKYVSRGFKVEGCGDDSAECMICNTFKCEPLIETRCCGKESHRSCMQKWNDCDRGEELTENRTKCPACRTFSMHSSAPLLYTIDFTKWAIVKCAICAVLFPHERGTTNCAEELVGANNNPLICVKCSIDFDPSIIIPGQRFKCPKCLNVAEFRGGCQQLTCCIYGTDKCRDGCNHGGLCGHKWTYKRD